MKVVGISHTTNANGVKNFTIYGTDEFEPYYNNQAEGRCAKGVRACSVYVGAYDCSDIPIGAVVEIYYDKAITTAKGTFQQVKRIDIISK